MRLAAGLSRGARFRAAAAVETVREAAERPGARQRDLRVVTFLDRAPADAELPELVWWVGEVQRQARLGGATWAMDSAGTGPALAIMLRDAARRGEVERAPHAVALSSGRAAGPASTPTLAVVSSLLAAYGEGLLSFAPGVDPALRQEAVRELVAYRPKFTAAGGISGEELLDEPSDWVTALALAVHFPGRGRARYMARGGGVFDDLASSPDPY